MSLSTTISGLVTKYASGQVDAKAVLGSIVANVALGVNQLIEASSMTFTEKAIFREDLKLLSGRAFRAKPMGMSANDEGDQLPPIKN